MRQQTHFHFSRIVLIIDHCFGFETQTSNIYETLVKRIVKASFAGINGTVFAYGPTGSGKTFTMMGKSSSGAEDPTGGKQSMSRSIGPDEPLDVNLAFRSTFEEGDGLIMIAARDIFRQISLESGKRFTLSCSYLEIYNDAVHDLLNTVEKLGEELQISEANVEKTANLE